MKKLIFILLLISITANAQSWNSIITTTINISDADYMENFANKSGIHVVTHEEYSNDIKYYLISSSGAFIRSATISTNGEFPNVVGDASNIYVVYKEGSNIRVKKSTDAGTNWTNKTDLPIGTDVCGGVDVTIDGLGIHTVWSIDNYGSETNYKKYSIANNNWVDFYNVTNYSGGYGTTPTVSVSPSRVHVGYNSNNYYDPPYFTFDANEMSRTKYSTTWQTQQQLATNESGLGKIFSASTKLYDFYYDLVTGPGHNLYFKYRNFGSTSWSSRTQLEINADVTHPLVICETDNASVHTYMPNSSGGITEKIIINGSINSSTTVTNTGSTLGLDANAVYNDVYVNWKDNYSNYLKLRQYDDAPKAPQNLSVSESSNEHPLLSWNANTDTDLKEYKVYRKGGYPFVDWSVIATPHSNSYEDTQLTTTYRHGEDFYYRVTAIDNGNNESNSSNEEWIEARLEKQINEEESKDEAKPTEYALNNNYPNPFNPSTQISYQIPKDGFVSLVIYNALGQEVETLISKQQSVGNYTVQFNAANLPSGVYIYKLQSGEFSATKKMLLMK